MYDAKVHDLFRITFQINTAEFEESRDYAIADALERVAAQVREGVTAGNIRDVNGNTIGDFGVKLADGHTMP